MPKFFYNQKGIAPIILIIILTVVIAGVAGVVYQSRKEIKVRSDKTSEVTELKNAPAEPKKTEIDLANSGKLADKPFEQKKTESSEFPGFSMTPPAGWEKKDASGDIQVGFLSPAQDKITENDVWFYIQPEILVRIVKSKFGDLDSSVEASVLNAGPANVVISKQKTEINGEAAYIVEVESDISKEVEEFLSAQIQQEITNAGKAGKNISRQDIQKDVDKLMQKAKLKVLTYFFRKNGYTISVKGQALESFWDKRGPQIKSSIDTFKFE